MAYQESIDLDDSAARVIARLADGGMRDGLSLLDQCASATVGELTAERVYACLGIAGERRCGEMMGYIAGHDTAGALSLFSTLYAEGKDLGALLDELACLVRDLLVIKTAPGAGIGMLSGVAEDKEVLELSKQLGSGELVRMMKLLQTTLAGFTRSDSRRMDAELCIVQMCRPELKLDEESLNARLTRLEEMIKTGVIPAKSLPVKEKQEQAPPLPTEEEPSEEEQLSPPPSEAPPGFWMELAAAARRELKPPASGFFVVSPNSPLQGVLVGDRLELRCSNAFTAQTIDKPEILEVVSRKAGAQLGRPIRAVVVDLTAKPRGNPRMEQLLAFGREHSDVIKIKNQY